MLDDQLPSVKEVKHSRFSVIWILPVLAACLGGWLFYKSIAEAPIEINVYFDTGEGIISGKTQVRYEGINVGKVKSVSVQPDMKGIIAVIEMDRLTEDAMRDETNFWLVKPEVTLSGVSGLGTLLSGNYITVRIGGGAPTTTFKALPFAPAKTFDMDGLHLTLKAKSLGSLSIGSPVLYNKFSIGNVESYQLEDDGRGVQVKLYIEPKFEHLVKDNTRFWNASGITVRGGITGFEVRTESLVSLLKGGVALTVLDDNSSEINAQDGDVFELYDGFLSAQSGFKIQVEFPLTDNITEDVTKVLYNGLLVGVVNTVDVKQDLSAKVVDIILTPRIEEYINKRTRLWLGRPIISLKDIRAVTKVLEGSYIDIDFDGDEGDEVRDFIALTEPPLIGKDAPGLHFTLTVDNLGSFSRDTSILYRNVPVGAVIDYRIKDDRSSVELEVHIQKKYSHLVNTSSRFWNVSNLSLKGNLSGFELTTTSVSNLVFGGISFFTPNFQAPAISKGSNFSIFRDYESASIDGIPITLYFEKGEGVKKGASIRYQGIELGKVTSVKLNAALNGVVVNAVLNKNAASVAKQNSRFWLVKPKLGLLKTAHLDTLLTGPYIGLEPGDGPASYEFEALLEAPKLGLPHRGLNLTLTAAKLGSIKEGVRVYYRQVPVGQVINVGLSNEADAVLININIKAKYSPLVRRNSQFWNASGVDMGFKIFGKTTIKTESVETILAGGISFATPNNDLMGEPVLSGAKFLLNDARKETWLKWAPKIKLE